MPRRTGQAAELAVENEAFNRWRILLRQRRFQKSLNRLRGQYQKWVKGPPITLYTYDFGDSYVDKFGTEIPCTIEGKISRKDVDLFDECDPNDHMVGMPEGAWHNFNSTWDLNLPKAALSHALPGLRQETINEWTAIRSKEPAVVPFPVKTGRSRRNWLRLEVNLSYPHDVLLERIEKELSKAMPRRRKARRRWDKFDDYLLIYDLAMKNETFATISHILKKRVSTVKSAFVSIARTISSFDPIGVRRSHARHGRAYSTKKQTVLKEFDYRTHIAQCERCTKAQTPGQFCPIVELYANQDARGQRELPSSHNFGKIEAAQQARKGLRRAYPSAE